MKHTKYTLYAAAFILVSFSLSAEPTVFHGQVKPGTVQAGKVCDKVEIVGVVTPYAYPTGRTDIQNIIIRHMDDGTDLNYQLGGALTCSDGAQETPQIVWVN